MEDVIQLSRFIGKDENILLIDVGANTGYWAQSLLDVFPGLKMIAFEPDPRAAEAYLERFPKQQDYLYKCALSDRSGFCRLNMADRTTFSTLEDYVENDGEIVGTVDVPVAKLDDFDAKIAGSFDKRVLKIDVQGHELNVIKGARDTLKSVDLVLLELSFAPEYIKNTPSFSAVTCELSSTGHYPIIFQNYGRSRSPYAIQRDVIFVKEPMLPSIFGW